MCLTSCIISCMNSLCEIIEFNMILEWIFHLCTPHIQLSVRSLSRAVHFIYRFNQKDQGGVPMTRKEGYLLVGCWPCRQSSSVQCSFAHLNLLFSLSSLRYGFFFATLPRRPASQSRLFTVDVVTGVLRVLFNEASNWGLVRRLFLKLDTVMYLSSCSVVHRGLPLLFLL
jgi:hypothetical protein